MANFPLLDPADDFTDGEIREKEISDVVTSTKCDETNLIASNYGEHEVEVKDEDFKYFSVSAQSMNTKNDDILGGKDAHEKDLPKCLEKSEHDGSRANNDPGTPVGKRYVTPQDFELLKVIGMGAFGKVLQVRNKKSKHILAMKIISKRLLKRKSTYVENVHAEREILTKVRHPFIVTMRCSFQSREKLFIIMDFLAGGELFLRLGREGIFLEKDAKFYIAEITLALEHLHMKGILHRDLKPENILLSTDGHLCLTDFGLAKDFRRNDDNEDEDGRALTVCGTQEYMAPEMVARKGYGKAADWWSLGCISYEMLVGKPPFESRKGAKDLFRKIMNERIRMPDGSSAAACILLKGLLNRNASARFGAAKGTMFQVGGVTQVKQLAFFSGLDWGALERKEIEPPQKLEVKGTDDLSHFYDEFTTMALPRSVTEMSRDEFRPRRCKSDAFRGFSFIQDDFQLPDRSDDHMDQYWNNIDEDGESCSDCASSVGGGNDESGAVNIAQRDLIPTLASTPEHAPEQKKKRPPRKRKKKKKTPEENSEKKLSTLPFISSNQNSNNEIPKTLLSKDAEISTLSDENTNVQISKHKELLVLPLTNNDVGKDVMNNHSKNTQVGPSRVAKKTSSDVWQNISSNKDSNTHNLNVRTSTLEKRRIQVTEKPKGSKPSTPSWETVSKAKGIKKAPHAAKGSAYQPKVVWARHASDLNTSSPVVPSQQIAKSNNAIESTDSDWRNHKLQQRKPLPKPPSLSNSTLFPSLGDTSTAKKGTHTATAAWGNKSSSNPWGKK